MHPCLEALHLLQLLVQEVREQGPRLEGVGAGVPLPHGLVGLRVDGGLHRVDGARRVRGAALLGQLQDVGARDRRPGPERLPGVTRAHVLLVGLGRGPPAVPAHDVVVRIAPVEVLQTGGEGLAGHPLKEREDAGVHLHDAVGAAPLPVPRQRAPGVEAGGGGHEVLHLAQGLGDLAALRLGEGRSRAQDGAGEVQQVDREGLPGGGVGAAAVPADLHLGQQGLGVVHLKDLVDEFIGGGHRPWRLHSGGRQRPLSACVPLRLTPHSEVQR